MILKVSTLLSGAVFTMISASHGYTKTLDPADLCATEWRNGNFKICEQAVATAPNDIRLLRLLAAAYVEIADFGQALEIYEKIAELAPSDPKAHEDLAGTHGFVRNYDEAIEALNRVMQLRPATSADYRALAIMRMNMSDFEFARTATRRAAELGDAIAMFDLATMHRDGRGGPVDLELAFSWTQRAAESGHLGAMALMRDVYLEGLYRQPIDEENAIIWAERLRAAEKSL